MNEKHRIFIYRNTFIPKIERQPFVFLTIIFDIGCKSSREFPRRINDVIKTYTFLQCIFFRLNI